MSIPKEQCQRLCGVDGCPRERFYTRQWCLLHHRRALLHGDPEIIGRDGPKVQDPAVRFWKRVQKTDTCWIWTGKLTHDGYSRFWFDGANVGGHRWSFEDANGPIPAGMQIDHLCRVRNCVNPDHMEVVTGQENLKRRDADRTHCPRNHPLSADNISLSRQGWRRCRTCLIEGKRRRRADQRAAGFSSRGKPVKS